MARKTVTTIHTPEPEAEGARSGKISFPGAKISEFGRVADSSGWFKFRFSPGSTLAALCGAMQWTLPGEHDTFKKVDGEFEGGHFVLACREKLTKDVEVDIEYTKINGFELHRLELEGRKGKGFRWEVRFKGEFKCEDGAANMESYMMRTDNAAGALTIYFIKQPVQQPLVYEEKQMPLGDEPASEMTQ